MTTITIATKKITLAADADKVDDALLDDVLDQFEAELLDLADQFSNDTISVSIED